MCCHYCGKSISPWYKGMPKGGQTGSLSRQGGGGGGGNKPKIQSCPHCKVASEMITFFSIFLLQFLFQKPLPRCAICLVNMGTGSGTTGANVDAVPDPSKVSTA